MSRKVSQELMQLDLYEILDLTIDSEENEIKKSYRKKALKCHPDKNPNNPDAAEEFDRLKKILEILLDPGARSAYDKLLRGRKAAAIRAKAADAKTQQLKKDLENREKRAQFNQPVITEEEKFRRELLRLEEEGERLIKEELDLMNKHIQEEIRKDLEAREEATRQKSFKVKVKWRCTEDWTGYTKEQIHQLFYKWGEINDVVVKNKEKRGSALIDYKEKSGADMAVLCEKGHSTKPLEVEHIEEKAPQEQNKPKVPKASVLSNNRDFETVTSMNQRRELERQKLIEQLLEEEALRS